MTFDETAYPKHVIGEVLEAFVRGNANLRTKSFFKILVLDASFGFKQYLLQKCGFKTKYRLRFSFRTSLLSGFNQKRGDPVSI